MLVLAVDLHEACGRSRAAAEAVASSPFTKARLRPCAGDLAAHNQLGPAVVEQRLDGGLPLAGPDQVG